MRLTLRAQLALLALLILLLPFAGLRSARDIEAKLVEAQQDGLVATARAASLALSERPGLFASSSPALRPLRVETVPDAFPLVLDGEAADWLAAGPATQNITLPDSEGRVRCRVARQGRSVFVAVEVDDDAVVRRSAEAPRIGQADTVELAMVTADDEFLRFAIQEAGDGSARVFLVDDPELLPDPRVEAFVVETDSGYRVEARLPRGLVGSSFGLAVWDVDDPKTNVLVSRFSLGDTRSRESLLTVFAPSPDADALLRALGRNRARLTLLDTSGRVLARAGNLTGVTVAAPERSWRGDLVDALRPLYGSILVEPREDFADPGPGVRLIESPDVARAASGWSVQWQRRTSDGRAVVLSAAEPVNVGDSVAGVVLAEETTNETVSARNAVFRTLFFSIFAATAVVAFALFVVAARVSGRIRRLRDAVDRSIDRHGRVRQDAPELSLVDRSGDEIGDVSRSFSSLLDRQRQYTSYLESLRGRLSHEVRTPVAVVRSSIDNLRAEALPENARVYLDRADEGLARLVTIVQRMTEAARLEQTLATGEKETFDLAHVIPGCVEGYRLAHRDRAIVYVPASEGPPLLVSGAPDLVAQLLDKLVENALDFAAPDTTIEVDLSRGLGVARLSVSNEGPAPPESLRGGLDLAPASRPPAAAGGIHLGLGLGIVRAIAEFHEAAVTVSDRGDGTGAVFAVSFPLTRN